MKGAGYMDESLRTDDFITTTIDKYSDMLIRVCFSYMKNMNDAEDIAQDVFVKLMEKKPSFEDDNHEKAWLIRVAINLSKNRLKTAWFRKTLPLDEISYNFTPKENSVMGAVLKLPAKYGGIILLYYFEEYNIAEIAAILGHKESTIGSQLHRARKLLKLSLREDFDDA
jgi:RNA polymerase sigma-70 factor, ECF subfamily